MSSVHPARRTAMMELLGSRGVAVVSSLPERVRNGDAHHVFRQHSDVLYLTGFTEPECVVVLRPGADRDRFVMFVRPRDPETEVWDGRRAGVDGARSTYGAEAAYPIAELDQRLPDLVANCEELHYAFGVDLEMDARIAGVWARLRRTEKKGKRPPRAVIDPRHSVHELRLHKGPEEIAALRRAAEITATAHIEVMRAGRPGVYEYQLEAILNYQFRKHGGSGPGYNSIVGAGENATILHYVENNRLIGANDLVLIDAGCEYQHYTADVTRTWPAAGRFSSAQREVYDLVLDVQERAIALAVPGKTIDDIHNFCVRGLTEGMIKLGLLAGAVDDRIADNSYRRFYMHGTSHWLGMDVHDVGAYTQGGKARPLTAGMVLTVEPGLYIAADAEGVPDRFRGIGVRIEDDVLVTDAAPDVLSRDCPKTVSDLERLCQG